MTEKSNYIKLQRTITDEFFRISGFSPRGVIRRLLGPLLWLPTKRFAILATEFDERLTKVGIRMASGEFVLRYSNGSQAVGVDNIPEDGPLILAANHPGTLDLFTVLSNIPRDDIRLIISGVPFIHNLYGMSKYLIYTTADPHGRMNVVRKATRHVSEGGCLMLFPTGILDPDPEIMPGAYEALGNWSRSIELILRRLPDTPVQVAIVSGVIPPSAMRNPLNWLVTEDWKKQRLAEFLLIASRLIRNKALDIAPKVSYGKSITVRELKKSDENITITDAIISQARHQLSIHLQIFPSYQSYLIQEHTTRV